MSGAAFGPARGPGGRWLLGGSVLYLAGAIVVTACNVPLNNGLAGLKPDQIGNAQGVWTTFQTQWLGWNHVRTVASVLASAAFTVALCRLRD